MSLVIIGNSGGTNIGDSFLRAAKELSVQTFFLDTRQAYQGPFWIKRIYWHFLGKRPVKLFSFSKMVIDLCARHTPKYLLAVGTVAISEKALLEIGRMGIKRINYLTDDPMNPTHYAPWFIRTISCYDMIFTPRRANIKDLLTLRCPQVLYLPFGYDPHLFYSEKATTAEEKEQFNTDVVFAGGADRDRVPFIAALLQSGITVALYGVYWQRFPETRNFTRGQADIRTLRLAISNAKIALCLVRRSNRDGHSMRSFEVPVINACMLVEDTPEHREIFGREGEAVLYFDSVESMLAKTRYLLENEQERRILADSVYQKITQGHNTYKDRLRYILDH